MRMDDRLSTVTLAAGRGIRARQVFANIITAWRDGYVDALSTPELPSALVRQHFDEIIASILNPDHYAVWHVPIVSGVKP